MRCTTIVIADRHPVFLHGLSQVLGEQADFRILACCSDGMSCVEAIRSLSPDIALPDVSMPDVAGIEMLAIVNSERLTTRLVFFAASVEERSLMMLGAAVLLAWVGYGRKVAPLATLACAPLYAAAKLPLYARFLVKRQVEWVRTRRGA